MTDPQWTADLGVVTGVAIVAQLLSWTVSPDAEPVVDPNVDLRPPARHREPAAARAVVLGVISVGGALGALARYGIEALLPTGSGGFPWGTFVINVTGCALIGVLMVLVTDVFPARRLLRPFVGVGVLGGFTTFSTYANEIRGLLRPGTMPVALAYLVATLVCALLAVTLGMIVTRAAVRAA
jgi:fluoride exporter